MKQIICGSIAKKILITGFLSANLFLRQNGYLWAQSVNDKDKNESFFKNDSTVLIDRFPEN